MPLRQRSAGLTGLSRREALTGDVWPECLRACVSPAVFADPLAPLELWVGEQQRVLRVLFGRVREWLQKGLRRESRNPHNGGGSGGASEEKAAVAAAALEAIEKLPAFLPEDDWRQLRLPEFLFSHLYAATVFAANKTPPSAAACCSSSPVASLSATQAACLDAQKAAAAAESAVAFLLRRPKASAATHFYSQRPRRPAPPVLLRLMQLSPAMTREVVLALASQEGAAAKPQGGGGACGGVEAKTDDDKDCRLIEPQQLLEGVADVVLEVFASFALYKRAAAAATAAASRLSSEEPPPGSGSLVAQGEGEGEGEGRTFLHSPSARETAAALHDLAGELRRNLQASHLLLWEGLAAAAAAGGLQELLLLDDASLARELLAFLVHGAPPSLQLLRRACLGWTAGAPERDARLPMLGDDEAEELLLEEALLLAEGDRDGCLRSEAADEGRRCVWSPRERESLAVAGIQRLAVAAAEATRPRRPSASEASHPPPRPVGETEGKCFCRCCAARSRVRSQLQPLEALHPLLTACGFHAAAALLNEVQGNYQAAISCAILAHTQRSQEQERPASAPRKTKSEPAPSARQTRVHEALEAAGGSTDLFADLKELLTPLPAPAAELGEQVFFASSRADGTAAGTQGANRAELLLRWPALRVLLLERAEFCRAFCELLPRLAAVDASCAEDLLQLLPLSCGAAAEASFSRVKEGVSECSEGGRLHKGANAEAASEAAQASELVALLEPSPRLQWKLLQALLLTHCGGTPGAAFVSGNEKDGPAAASFFSSVEAFSSFVAAELPR